MRNVSDESCREIQNTFCVQIDYRAVYEIVPENMVEPDRPQMTIWRMRVACRITKATNTHNM